MRNVKPKRTIWTGPIPGCEIETPHPRKGCRRCHAADMRRRRDEGKEPYVYGEKQRARGILGVYVRRGKVQKKPCEHSGCGKTTVQAHHPDYSKPLDVVWLCRRHHQEITNAERFGSV